MELTQQVIDHQEEDTYPRGLQWPNEGAEKAKMLEAHHLSRSTCPNFDLEAFPTRANDAGSAPSLRSSHLDFQFSTCLSD